MEQIFIKVLNLAVSSSLLILAVILIRILFQKAPKWCLCLLWGIVAIALIVPFRLQTRFSLIPNYSELFSEQNGLIFHSENTTDVLEKNDAQVPLNSNTEVISNGNSKFAPVPDPIKETSAKSETNIESDFGNEEVFFAPEPLRWTQIAGVVWVFGIAVMVLYGLFSYLFLIKKVSTAVREEKNVYLSDSIKTSFILGIVNPRIYLPFGIESEDKKYILAHEKTHQKRLDYLSKLLAFAVLTIYWFHPLVWVSFVLFNRDIELACDEKVIRQFDLEQRKKYSQTLLKYSMQNNGVLFSPPAFGKEGVKMRIHHVIQYKQPKFWSVFLLIVVCIPLTACLMTSKDETEQSSEVVVEEKTMVSTADIGIPSLYVVNRDGDDISVFKSQSVPSEKPSELIEELPVVENYRTDVALPLKFEQEPSKVDVKCWPEKRAESWDEDFKRLQYSVHYGKVVYVPYSRSDCKWIYQITAEYPQGECQYYFKVDAHGEKPEYNAFSSVILCSDIEPTGCKVEFRPSGNLEGIEYHSETWGYFLQKTDDMQWNLNNTVGFVKEVIPVEEGMVKINWEDTYGKLPAGLYRLNVYTTDYLSGDNRSVSICYGGFEIGD